MFYVKNKELTKPFNFSKVMSSSDLPGYIHHYIYEDEQILVSYKTSRDHAVFTDQKLVLFDSLSRFGIKKQMVTIPYKSISTISIMFSQDRAEFDILLDSGYPTRLKFIDLQPSDKVRLRILYTCINRIMANQKPNEVDIKRLLTDDVSFR